MENDTTEENIMKNNCSKNIAMKVLFAIITVIVAYFSVVSTITVAKVDALDTRFFGRVEEIKENEKNIAVLVEKVNNIERMVQDIHNSLIPEHKR